MPSVSDPAQAARLITEELRRRAILPAMDRYGQKKEGELKALVSTGFPPPSEAGQAPHRRSGGYRATISHVTRSVPNGVVSETGTTSVIGAYLEFGTSRMAARPHFKTLYNSAVRQAAFEVASLLSSGN